MRLGLYPAKLVQGTLVRELYNEPYVEERHRHRYEVSNAYRAQLEAAGLVVSGTSPDGRLVEFIELPKEVHPYFVATQAHPELRSRPIRPHPLFAGLVAAALARQREMQLPVDDVAMALSKEDGVSAVSSTPSAATEGSSVEVEGTWIQAGAHQ
jgi:CTP synthase